MKPIERGEVMGLADYEVIRDRFRARVIEEKKTRRVALGPLATCVFENRDTVLMQIQEMLRTERITRESSVLHEIETYNELVPGDLELSATVMIEIDDKAQRESFLVEAAGFERHVAVEVAGERFGAKWSPSRELEGRTSAVHYLKFPVSPAAKAAIAKKAAPVKLLVDHPKYGAEVTLSPTTLASLATDFE